MKTLSLSEIIDEAKRDFATWPKWMQDVAHWDCPQVDLFKDVPRKADGSLNTEDMPGHR